MNALGRPFARRLPAFALEEASLLDAARRATGLEDFGDGAFREGLAVHLRTLEADAHLTPLGRAIARGEIVRALETRLRLADWRARHPEIAEERVERPVIILGMGRTGTTILHDLIARDPGVRVPLTWELEAPCPPPEAATYTDDPRIAEADRRLDRVESLIPDFKRMHPMGARLPQECVRILTLEFASMQFHVSYRQPGYVRWLHEEADLGPAYAAHRRMLQLLQWRCPGRWVLKSPCHLWHLEAVVREYPDAVFVQTHRDPLKVLSSLTSLTTTLRAMASDRVDPAEIARTWSALNLRAYEASVDARESGLLEPGRVLDLQFTDFMADPWGTLRHLYAFAGLPWTEEAELRMRAWWDAHPSDEHGRHAHRFSDTGLDEAEERAKVARYQRTFGVPTEPL